MINDKGLSVPNPKSRHLQDAIVTSATNCCHDRTNIATKPPSPVHHCHDHHCNNSHQHKFSITHQILSKILILKILQMDDAIDII